MSCEIQQLAAIVLPSLTPPITEGPLEMRYPLTLLFTLLAASTAMADEFVCTDVLEGDTFSCDLTDPAGNELGSGCFVFASTQASGLLSADLTIVSPDGMSVVESTWECSCGTRQPEEDVQCRGFGPVIFPFAATAAGEVTGDDLVLDTVGYELIPGPGGIATCVRDPGCET